MMESFLETEKISISENLGGGKFASWVNTLCWVLKGFWLTLEKSMFIR